MTFAPTAIAGVFVVEAQRNEKHVISERDARFPGFQPYAGYKHNYMDALDT